MLSRNTLMGVSALAMTVLVAFVLNRQAANDWTSADFEARALRLIGGQLPREARDGLVAKSLPEPPSATDRFVCVMAPAASTRTAVAYEVQFRRGTFGTKVNQIYTPQWQPANSGAIARQDCAATAQ
jgi:hypothetical protein